MWHRLSDGTQGSSHARLDGNKETKLRGALPSYTTTNTSFPPSPTCTMSLTTSACGNAQNGQKVTLDDDDFHIYTLYIPSGSKHDLQPLKAMLVVLNTDESTSILPDRTPVHFHAIAYPPPTTYVQSADDWDLVLTVMSYDLQPLDVFPTTTAGESPSLTFKISGPITHLSHDGNPCLLIDVCPEDYWLVGYVFFSQLGHRLLAYLSLAGLRRPI